MRCFIRLLVCVLALAAVDRSQAAADPLAEGFANPPPEARIRAYWWWLNGNVTREAITRDLEEMKAKGFGGALICDAGGADQRNNDPVPHGPDFFSPAWRELYRHALHEAARLGLEISLNIQSGWNLGGPSVTADDTAKKLTWSEADVAGNTHVVVTLPRPAANDGYYRDVRLLAWRINPTQRPHAPLKNYPAKALVARPTFAGPDGWMRANSAVETAPIFAAEEPTLPGEEDASPADVIDLTAHFRSETNTLDWSAPPGRWHLLRLGATLCDNRFVSTHSGGWSGYALDVLDRGAFERYWDAIVEPLITDAGPLAGRTLRYLHTDSWEVDAFNWTPTVVAEFSRRRGYDPVPWLPVLAGRIVGDRERSNRFLHDYRRTLGDLAADNHYRVFHERAARHGLGIHPEAGGPHFTPVDAQQCLAIDDVPMAEFWVEAYAHRATDEFRFFVKQPASAAHTAGHRFVAAEGFTNIGLHWQERLWSNLKPTFDRACIEGLNRLVWHAFVCSPETMGVPGQQYFAGTHLNPNVTWWQDSAAFFAYLNRCQFLLQRGVPVSDVLYYYGDDVPNFTQLRSRDPAQVGRGYDYDVIALEQLLTRVSVRDGLLVLPEGTRYRALVLPNSDAIAPLALGKIQELVAAGATVVGPQPARAEGLSDFPQCDEDVRRVAQTVWPNVETRRTANEVLRAAGVPPDFSADGVAANALDYIHRREGDTEIYFVRSAAREALTARLTFRVKDKAPELWDPLTGESRFALDYQQVDGGTTVPFEFPPCGSIFVVFRSPATQHPPSGESNTSQLRAVATIDGAWRVHFDPKWGGPNAITFPSLVDWTQRPEDGIRHYSGTAVYRIAFDAPAGATTLDLGDVREVARVRLNGHDLGVVWAPPFRVSVAGLLRATGNQLEIEVVNFWANRVIGDEALAPAERLTHTNVRALVPSTPLMPSGLLGPVRLLQPADTTASGAVAAARSGR